MNPILKENSKRLKKFLTPFNPILGDPNDPDRFLLNVPGFKKTYLPVEMKEIPFIKILISKGKFSKFIRSQFFKVNFHSVAHFYKIFNSLRLKYDFPFWIALNFNSTINLKNHVTLIRYLQKIRWKKENIRIIIRKNPQCDISSIINLFIIWIREYSPKGLNVMSIHNSSKKLRINRDFYLNYKAVSSSSIISFQKTEFANSLYSPLIDSKFWFGTVSNPDFSRGRSFSYLILHDVHTWKDQGKENIRKVIQAAFPVVPDDTRSAIILTTDHASGNKFIRKEWLAVSFGKSPFNTLSIPWYEALPKILKFDFPEDKISFFKNLLRYRHRRKFPHFPNTDSRYLYSLWQLGLPLEIIHWFATESLYYKSSSQFLRNFPV